jgi:hypothetical protein
MPIRLLVLDIDGTVTDSRHEVPEATHRAVRSLRDAGIRVMLATGRRYRDALPVATTLGLDAPLVTASGALVKSPVGHTTLRRAGFATGVLERVLATVVAAGHEPIVYGDSFADGFDFYCRRLDVAATAAGGGLAHYLARNMAVARCCCLALPINSQPKQSSARLTGGRNKPIPTKMSATISAVAAGTQQPTRPLTAGTVWVLISTPTIRSALCLSFCRAACF